MRFIRFLAFLVTAIRIIVAPAWRPLMQLFGCLGVLIAPIVIYIGIFVCEPRDFNRGRHFAAALQIESFTEALHSYRIDCGTYPSAGQGLAALVRDTGTAGWRGPYLQFPELPVDPWGSPYVYSNPTGTTPEIISYGADKRPRGEFLDGDISSRHPHNLIPPTPREVAAKRILAAIWIGAWLWLITSLAYCLRAGSTRNATQ